MSLENWFKPRASVQVIVASTVLNSGPPAAESVTTYATL